jgi:hypothetical protein
VSFSQSEVYTFALHAGMSTQKSRIAAAIAMAESGGDPNAHNTNAETGDNSYGIWQINMKGKLGPERRSEFGLKNNEALYDPKTNARVMAELSLYGHNFKPWTTYKNGKYKAYLDNPVEKTSNSTVDTIKSIPGVGAATDAAQALARSSEVLAKSAVWLSNPQNWTRVAFVVGGGVVAVAGIVMVLQSSSAGRAATKTATGVARKVAPL